MGAVRMLPNRVPIPGTRTYYHHAGAVPGGPLAPATINPRLVFNRPLIIAYNANPANAGQR